VRRAHFLAINADAKFNARAMANRDETREILISQQRQLKMDNLLQEGEDEYL
jgi:hypothetical protein